MHGVAPAVQSVKRVRDVRLDFFRGLAMFIIFVAHVPNNPVVLFIPAQFGFSSAAEMFVFCSGVASGLAFGGVFIKRGFWLGFVRVLHRIWQVYWSHIGLCLVVIAVYFIASDIVGRDLTSVIGIDWLKRDPMHALPAMLELRYTPYFLDILPMYVVLLASIPLVMLLSRVHRLLPLALGFCLWLTARTTGINLPSGETGAMFWFFNPFSWQLLFFTGFSFSMGWLPPLKFIRGKLFYLCLVVILIALPICFWAFQAVFPNQSEFREWLVMESHFGGITFEHEFRYLHFLALAYVVLTLVEPIKARLNDAWAAPIVLVGQQSLATFMASLALALTCGIILEESNQGWFTILLINLAGLSAIIATSRIARFFKQAPWKAANRP